MSKKVIGFLNLFNSPNLGALTEKRTLGSTSFLGRFALMDFPLSNFTNSGIDNFNILIKDNFRSVSKHVGSLKAWVNNAKISRQNLLINEKGLKNPKINTDINCILNNDWVLYETKADAVIILPAHIIDTIDLRPLLDQHFASDADVTLVYSHINNADEAFLTSNIVTIKDRDVVSLKKNNGKIKEANVSLETYVIGANTLQRILRDSDFSNLKSLKEAIVKFVANKSARVKAYEYVGYVRCFDSFQHFVDYSFELLDYNIAKNLYGKDWPIYTLTHNTPPAKYTANANVSNSFIANGAYIGGTIKNSIVSRYVEIGEGAVIEDSIILTGTYIDPGAVIKNAVIDKYCHIASSAKIEGKKTSPIYLEQGTFYK